MMRYAFSGAWRSFTTAGGGPAGGHARPRAPPPQAASAMTMPLRATTRVGAAACIGLPPIGKRVVRRRAALEPLAERGGVLGQTPLLEDRQRHRPHAAVARAGGQALLVQPLLEAGRIGVGGDGPLEQLPLDRQADRVRRRVAFAAPPPPFRRVERGEELGAHDRRARVHASPWRRDLHQPPLTSTNLHQARRSVIPHSNRYPRPSGRRYPRSSAAMSSGTVVRSSIRIAQGASGRTVVTPFR